MSAGGTAQRLVDLVADIGGTNARFALVRADGRPAQVRTFAVARFADPLAACRAYLAAAGRPRLRRAAFALAATVADEPFKLTNAHWVFDRKALRAALGVQELLLLNDFTAIAWSLPTLSARDGHQIGPGSGLPGAPLAVIGPGTGLGASGLLPDRGRWLAICGEGGHSSLSPANEQERALLALLWRDHPHVSFERLLCGSGLVLLAQTLAELNGWPQFQAPVDAAQVTSAALAGQAWARETVQVFCALLGTAAGNLALTLGARGGVYLAGGIVPRFGPMLAQSGFRARFEAKGRFRDYLHHTPTFVVTAEQPGLRGAALALRSV